MKFKKIVATCLTLSSLALPVCASASASANTFSSFKNGIVEQKRFPDFNIYNLNTYERIKLELKLWEIRLKKLGLIN